MREIKFRILDKINRVWLNRFNANLLNIGALSNVEINQYTGLKDNHGIEIYEGDILLSSNEHGTFLQLIGFGDNDRDEDSMLIGFKIINGCTLENDDYEIDECKPLTQELVKKYNIPTIQPDNIIMDGWWVVGNKYENKELLDLFKK